MTAWLFQKAWASVACALLVTTGTSASAQPALVRLNHRVLDAEYSASLEKIVTVSSAPARLHIYDPLTASDISVDLPLDPKSVSVAPDGLHAAVGHDGWVSYVNLHTGQLLKTISVSANAGDIVLAGDGFVYAFPSEDQWVDVHAVSVATGAETISSHISLYEDARVRLHPSGIAVYAVDTALSPGDIRKYSIGVGIASSLYDSPYHGEYPMCGNLWISEDGARIVTACGHVFRSSSVQSQDILYNGTLSAASQVRDAVHSTEAGRVLVVATQTPASDTVVQIYNHLTLAFEGALPIPDFVLATGTYAAHARFVFFNAAGTQRFAIVQADASAGLRQDFGVVTFDTTPVSPSPSPPTLTPAAAPNPVTADGHLALTAVVVPGLNPVSTGLTVTANLTTMGGAAAQVFYDDGSHGDRVAGDLVFSFTATVPPGPPRGTQSLAITVSDAQGRSTTRAMPVSIPAVITGQMGLNPLSFQVIDAEYSLALEKIVMVAAGPSRLIIHDPRTALETTVALSHVPTAVSVAPDGLHAAVGHNGWLSYVDLQTGQLEKTLPVATTAWDVVLAGNGFAHVFPQSDQWVSIHSVNIAAGTDTLGTGSSIYEQTRARLHPSGSAIYGAWTRLNPTDLEKYSIANGPAEYLYNSRYHGDYEMCGNLWFSEDGRRILTACGRAFEASNVEASDVIYDGSLAATVRVRDAVHSAEARKFLVVTDLTTTSDTEVLVFDDNYLALEGVLPLPDFVTGTGVYDAHARFVFYSRDGSQRFAIVQADPSAGLLFDHAVVAFDSTPISPSADGDGLPDEWETSFGLDPQSAATDDGADGDPDHDGRSNQQEWQEGTHPRGFFTRYFAEGATGAFFDTSFALISTNPSAVAHVLLHFQRGDGTTVSRPMTLGPRVRATFNPETIPSLQASEFSTVIESDEEFVADRRMTWGDSAYGSHAETSIATPATAWYLAEGATHSGFNLFYLVQNPNRDTAVVRVTYLLPAPNAPIERSYHIGPRSRFNIWVDAEPGLSNTDVSAVITSDLPVIVERAMYLDRPDQVFGAGHESAAIATPSTEWFLAEGATGTFFDLFVLIANPGTSEADVRATFLLPDGTSLTRRYTVAPTSRFNIWVDTVDPLLVDAAVSTIIESLNGVPIIVERAMWWPGPTAATWAEAHNSAGLTSTGRTFAIADGELGGSAGTDTYILIANRGDDDDARVTLFYEDGTSESKTFHLGANSRTNVPVGFAFPKAAGRRFGAIVEALGASPQIAVERSVYSNANGIVWAAGTNATATKLQ